MREVTVDNDGVAIATRDYGGDGVPLLLVPGAGGNLVGFEPIVPFLAEGHRIVSMDMRCHGGSADAAWSIDGVLSDLRAVIAHHRMTKPGVIGHSLGGMLAALLAAEAGALTAAVNLDGHGQGTPDLYDGMERSEVETRLAELLTLLNPPQPATASKEDIDALRSGTAQAATDKGLSADLAIEMVDRGLEELPDGSFRVRPGADVVADILASIRALDLLGLSDRTTVPLLVYNARSLSDLPPGLPSWVPELMASYRRGLALALTELSERNPLVSYQEVDTGHGVHVDAPELVAKQVRAFVDR